MLSTFRTISRSVETDPQPGSAGRHLESVQRGQQRHVVPESYRCRIRWRGAFRERWNSRATGPTAAVARRPSSSTTSTSRHASALAWHGRRRKRWSAPATGSSTLTPAALADAPTAAWAWVSSATLQPTASAARLPDSPRSIGKTVSPPTRFRRRSSIPATVSVTFLLRPEPPSAPDPTTGQTINYGDPNLGR